MLTQKGTKRSLAEKGHAMDSPQHGSELTIIPDGLIQRAKRSDEDAANQFIEKVTELTVKGVHFVQEDSPHEIGQAVASWMKKLR